MKAIGHLLNIAKNFGVAASALELADLFANRLAKRRRYLMYGIDKNTAAKGEATIVSCKEVGISEALALADDAAYSIDRKFIQQAFQDGCRVFVAVANDMVVGYQFLSNTSHVHNFKIGFGLPERSAYLFRGFVHADYRGRGIIEILIRHACWKSDASMFYSSTRNTNFRMRNAFKRIGFKPCGGFVISTSQDEMRDSLSVDKKLADRGFIVSLVQSA